MLPEMTAPDMIAPLIVASSTVASLITRTSLLVLVAAGTGRSVFKLVGLVLFDMLKV